MENRKQIRKAKLPTGIDDFQKIRTNNYYYVDKTAVIEQVLENGSEVTLFTRPRRFGKSLNMSMMQCFFEAGADASLFENLYISKTPNNSTFSHNRKQVIIRTFLLKFLILQKQ